MNDSSTGHLLPRRALLFFAGPAALLVAGFFIWLAVGELREDTQRLEEYPFSLTPEFPSLGQSDVEALRSAALTYMSLPQWTSINSNWNIVDTDVLTKGGTRIGTSASLEFDLRVSLVGPLQFFRCGVVEIWNTSNGGAFNIYGVQIWLLDGRAEPYRALPLNTDGLLPTKRDIQEFTGDPGPPDLTKSRTFTLRFKLTL